MARIAVLGEHSRVAGYALAGADVLPADDDATVRAAWTRLVDAGDVDVVVLTRRATRALPDGWDTRERPLTVVMPG